MPSQMNIPENNQSAVRDERVETATSGFDSVTSQQTAAHNVQRVQYNRRALHNAKNVMLDNKITHLDKQHSMAPVLGRFRVHNYSKPQKGSFLEEATRNVKALPAENTLSTNQHDPDMRSMQNFWKQHQLYMTTN